ncbi:MAG: DNA topoisomerase III [Giesbergeria sp.]|nr:DNA topoisomerase III [Giesbergeria sp.]
MSKTLVIAEKPSVAQDIVRALTPVAGKFDKHEDHFENDQYVVTSAVGHLVEIQAPEQYDVKRGKWSFAHLPVIPPHFDLKPVEKTKSRLSAVVKQAKRKDVTQLINACDAGREGELIFRLIEQYAGGAKGALGKPVQRLWLQSMTPQAIREGFEHLRSDAQMQGLADAARSRSEADWLVGINGTRAMTAFNSQGGGFFLTTVGRVQTPTLSLVVEREEKIRKFVSRDYWEIHASFGAQAGDYPGKWFDPQWKKGDDPEAKADRVWSQAQAQSIADAVRGQPASVTEESKPTTQASPLLFDLTSLQREANGKFGFSAKTTLALAQSLYERHKALTYPRTDSRALPEDYLPVAKQTFEMLADSGMRHLAPHALTALNNHYVRPSKRIFDNSKVSDHFAIIPTLQAPSGLSEAEQKLYDLVVRRFMAVFFPSAEYTVTTRISTVAQHSFKTEGKVLVKPGWLAIYGKEAADEVEGGQAGDKGQNLVPVKPGEVVRTEHADPKGLKTKPPARYSEATLLGAMESAGKQIDDDELREAMQEKGLGTPATRAAIIEGLLTEKYMLREGRELIPTAKAFQLMTLLRGLEVEELCRADLTGEWEYKLAQMEKGQLSREAFMREIAAMTERMVKKAKEYDRDTIPGDYATLSAPCPNCGGVVKENYRRYACVGRSDDSSGAGAGSNSGQGCGFSFGKSPAGRTFETAEAEQLLAHKRIGPLEGFRSKAGWPFTAEITISFDEETKNYKLEFDFGDDRNAEESGELVEFADASLGACPVCGSAVHEHGSNYVCARAVPTAEQPTPSCTFKSGKVILQQPVERAQMEKLLATGKTDLLDKFVSMRTRRAFKAFLVWDKEAGKVNFEFEQRESKYPPRKTAARTATKTIATSAAKKSAAAKKAPKEPKATAPKAPRKSAPGKAPSAALAAVIGAEPVSRPEAVKKLWDYIKAQGLQDPKDKRTIRPDAKLQAVLGKPEVGMFELAGLLGPHLG